VIEVDEAFVAYLDKVSGVRESYHRDAQFRFQITLCRYLCDVAAAAMEAEGFPLEVRERVVRAMLWGSGTVAESEQRQRQHAAMVKAARGQRPDSVSWDLGAGYLAMPPSARAQSRMDEQ
jgi:hypothetical protein